MRVPELLAAITGAGISLEVDGNHLRVRGRASRLTDEIRSELVRLKPVLLDVLPRLAGMRIHTEPVPTAKSAREAPGGPGRCFSCGDGHDHPHAYGRCVWCALALDCYYVTLHASGTVMVVGDKDLTAVAQ